MIVLLLDVDWVELHENTIPESLEKKILVLYGGKLTIFDHMLYCNYGPEIYVLSFCILTLYFVVIIKKEFRFRVHHDHRKAYAMFKLFRIDMQSL